MFRYKPSPVAVPAVIFMVLMASMVVSLGAERAKSPLTVSPLILFLMYTSPVRVAPLMVGEVASTTEPVPVEETMLMVGEDPPEEARGDDAETEVTGGVRHDKVPPPFVVRTWPFVPVELG